MACSRCGAEDSMFWYPYAFGVVPVQNVTDGDLVRAQYFMLCDKCQQDFTDFMQKRETRFDVEKLKKMLEDAKPVPFIPEVD